MKRTPEADWSFEALTKYIDKLLVKCYSYFQNNIHIKDGANNFQHLIWIL